MTLPAPTLEHVCDLAVTIAAPIEVGPTPQGFRRMIPITGGKVTGPLLQGHVLAGGADFQLITGDGTEAHLDARYVLELSDGSRIFVQNTALRVASAEDSAKIRQGQPVDPSRVYFRCQPKFEATTPAWHWLSTHQFVGVGMRLPDAVHLSFYKVA
jgi:hypothetical protein